MAPRFSILLPTHNRARLLRLALLSLLTQTEQDFEVLVVGDGCTDDTASVVASLEDSRVRWFDLPKAAGFGYANRNVALAQAAGEYIAFLADDDLVLPDHLAVLCGALEDSGAEWAYSRPLWVTTDGLVVPFASNLLNPDELDTFLAVGNHIPASCVMYRRGCLDAYGYWPEDVPRAGDWRYWVRILEGGGRANLAYSPVPSALHFNADWKTTPETQAVQVVAAGAIAETASWWPRSLRVTIPAGVSEQEALFELIGRADYVTQLRRDVTRVVERLAWIHLSEAAPRERRVREAIERSESELARTTEELGRLDARLSDAETRLDVVLTSRSWRVTSPLRAIARALRREGTGPSPRRPS